MRIGDIVEFEFNGNKYKGQYLETQKTIFNEDIVKLKLLNGNSENLKLGKNKILLLKNGEFFMPYNENEKEVLIKNKKTKDLTKTRNFSLF